MELETFAGVKGRPDSPAWSWIMGYPTTSTPRITHWIYGMLKLSLFVFLFFSSLCVMPFLRCMMLHELQLRCYSADNTSTLIVKTEVVEYYLVIGMCNHGGLNGMIRIGVSASCSGESTTLSVVYLLDIYTVLSQTYGSFHEYWNAYMSSIIRQRLELVICCQRSSQVTYRLTHDRSIFA